jgi:hypothetical protein
VAKHKSGGNMPIPSDGTTFSHNIKEDGNAIRTNGERPRWITPYQKTSIYKSNVRVSKIKVQKTFKILVKLGLIIHKWGCQDDTKTEKDSGFTPLTHLPSDMSDPLLAAQYKNIQTTVCVC